MAVATRYAGRGYGLAAALLLTLAIVSHHFTAMGAVDVIADPTQSIQPFSLDPASLALAVAAAAVLILGLSLAGALADRRLRERDLQLVNAVNNMSHGIVMFDAAERLVVCNDRYIEVVRVVARRRETGHYAARAHAPPQGRRTAGARSGRI